MESFVSLLQFLLMLVDIQIMDNCLCFWVSSWSFEVIIGFPDIIMDGKQIETSCAFDCSSFNTFGFRTNLRRKYFKTYPIYFAPTSCSSNHHSLFQGSIHVPSTRSNSIDGSICADINVILVKYKVRNLDERCWGPGTVNLADPGTKTDSPGCQ